MLGEIPLQEAGTMSAKTPWRELVWSSLAMQGGWLDCDGGVVRGTPCLAGVLPLLNPPPQDMGEAVRTGRQALPPPADLLTV